MRTQVLFTLFTLLALTVATAAGAQSSDPTSQDFIEAQRAEAKGDYRRAESLYSEAVKTNPQNASALLGRARMNSWLGDFTAAIKDYEAVLAIEPENPRALSGLGWTYAWNKNYDEAKKTFEHLKSVEPYYLDAQKGLAYVELWRGNAIAARQQFEILAREDQGNPDYVVAIGQAAYLQGDLPAARTSFRQALDLKPGFEAARSGLAAVDAAAVNRRPAVTILAGRSSSGDVANSGLRMAQIAIQPNPRARWWITHDRGVGFDGLSADRRQEDAATTTVGGFFNFTPKTGTRFEAGIRDLPGETQPVVSAEQVFFLSNMTPKIGVWAADGDEGTQWVLNVGVHRWLTPRFALEPTVYLGNDGQNQEVRGAVLGTFRIGARAEAGLGFALGTKDTDTGSAAVDRIFANLAIPISDRVRFMFYGWREGTEGFEDQTVLAAGITANL
jgi:tetratricopeptide (TPR) repeat protein